MWAFRVARNDADLPVIICLQIRATPLKPRTFLKLWLNNCGFFQVLASLKLCVCCCTKPICWHCIVPTTNRRIWVGSYTVNSSNNNNEIVVGSNQNDTKDLKAIVQQDNNHRVRGYGNNSERTTLLELKIQGFGVELVSIMLA